MNPIGNIQGLTAGYAGGALGMSMQWGLAARSEFTDFYASSLMKSDGAMLGRFLEQGQAAGINKDQQRVIFQSVLTQVAQSDSTSAREVLTNFNGNVSGSLGLDARGAMQQVAGGLNDLWSSNMLSPQLVQQVSRTLGAQGTSELVSLLSLHGSSNGPNSLLAHLVGFSQNQGMSDAAMLGQQFLSATPDASSGFSNSQPTHLDASRLTENLGEQVQQAEPDVRSGAYSMSAQAGIVALAQLANIEPKVLDKVIDLFSDVSSNLMDQAYEAVLPSDNAPVVPAAFTILQARGGMRWNDPPQSRDPRSATLRCAADLRVLLSGLSRNGGSGTLEDVGRSLADYFGHWVLDSFTSSETFDAIEAELINFVQDQLGGRQSADIFNTLCNSIVEGGALAKQTESHDKGFFQGERVRERTAKLLSSVLAHACAQPARGALNSNGLLPQFSRLSSLSSPTSIGLRGAEGSRTALGNSYSRPFGGATAPASGGAHELNVFFYNAMMTSKRVSSPGQEMFVMFYDQFARILDVINTNGVEVSSSSQQNMQTFAQLTNRLPDNRSKGSREANIYALAQALMRHRAPS